MELSKRLRALAELVTPGDTVADVGTDHAYLPIYLLNSGKSPRAIAMDVREGPLQHAEENRRKYLKRGELSLRLSNGLEALKPGETQCVVLAGMGGGLMIRILKERMEKDEMSRLVKTCILQPQSEIRSVREFLNREGFRCIQEKLVEDRGKYYSMMKLLPPQRGMQSDRSWEEEELLYGKLLLERRDPLLKELLLRDQSICTRILHKLEKNLETAGEKSGERRIWELHQELDLIRQALRRYD